MQDLIQKTFGKETIYFMSHDVKATFAFSGATSLTKFFIASDINVTAKVDTLLSFFVHIC